MSSYKTGVAVFLSLAVGGLGTAAVLAPRVNTARGHATSEATKLARAEAKAETLQGLLAEARREAQRSRDKTKQVRRRAARRLELARGEFQTELDAAYDTVALLRDEMDRPARFRAVCQDFRFPSPSEIASGETQPRPCRDWEFTQP